jgi:hypothetical protein
VAGVGGRCQNRGGQRQQRGEAEKEASGGETAEYHGVLPNMGEEEALVQGATSTMIVA